MEEPAVRAHAEALGAAIVAGDIDRAIQDFSNELRQHIGEVISLLPLPAREATVDSVERGGTGFIAVIRLVGETDEVTVQTRWKERDGVPKVVEVSHLSRTVAAVPAANGEGELEGSGDEAS